MRPSRLGLPELPVRISADLDAARERLRQSAPARARNRDFMTPREIAARVGVSYYSVLRAIRRGELAAFQVVGRLRIEISEYERWTHARPVQVGATTSGGEHRRRARTSNESAFAASLRELEQEVA
jgi:excisionase family DNA binding protein